MTTISKRQQVFFLIYKAKKIINVFIYKKSDTLKKARQFALRLYIQKVRHFTLRNFHENFEINIYIQKARHFSLRDVFIYKNPDTWQKTRQFALRFICKKQYTLR